MITTYEKIYKKYIQKINYMSQINTRIFIMIVIEVNYINKN